MFTGSERYNNLPSLFLQSQRFSSLFIYMWSLVSNTFTLFMTFWGFFANMIYIFPTCIEHRWWFVFTNEKDTALMMKTFPPYSPSWRSFHLWCKRVSLMGLFPHAVKPSINSSLSSHLKFFVVLPRHPSFTVSWNAGTSVGRSCSNPAVPSFTAHQELIRGRWKGESFSS